MDPNADAKDEAEARLLRRMKRRLNGQQGDIMDALGDPPDINNLGPEFWNSQAGSLLADLRPEVERMVLAGIASAGTTVPIVWDEAVIAKEAADWAAQYTYELVKGINANTERLLRDQIRRFIETPGMTIGQLRDSIAAAFGDVRAQMIAVTETTRAFAQGERLVQQYLQRAGLRMRRHWSTSMDERVCPICAPLDGKPENEWGSHSGGPPAHVRCILPGNLVLAPGGIDAAAKSFYAGRAVEIVLSGGSRLTVTENHPVLTARGWVPAQFLNKRDKVVYSANPERIAAAIDPDNHDVPTMIEQVFGALMEMPGMVATSMPVAPEDLHGDGRGVNGYIDVVHPDGALLRDLQAMSTQGGSQLMLNGDSVVEPSLIRSGVLDPFIDRDGAATTGRMGVGEHGGALFGSGISPADVHAVRDVAGPYARLFQSATECPAINPRLARDFLLRFASEVTLQELVQVRDVYLEVGGASSGRQARPPAFDEATAKDAPTDARFSSGLLQGASGEVTLIPVVEVRNFDFAGHVFDLQSDMFELYICNGVVVKNCRCWTTLRRAQ